MSSISSPVLRLRSVFVSGDVPAPEAMPKTTPGVAGFYARVGRAAAQVFAGEVFDDVLVDLFGKIQDVVRDADDLRRALGVPESRRRRSRTACCRDD